MRPGGFELAARGLEVRRSVYEDAGSAACSSQTGKVIRFDVGPSEVSRAEQQVCCVPRRECLPLAKQARRELSLAAPESLNASCSGPRSAYDAEHLGNLGESDEL